MELKEVQSLVTETIKYPVRYDALQQTIWDANGLMVCNIKGWSKIQFMQKSEKRQDAIGEVIAELLNDYIRNFEQAELIMSS